MTEMPPGFLSEVLSIAKSISRNGDGLSLDEAMERCRYRERREAINAECLATIIRASPQLVADWVRYCEDKRTSGGFWFSSRDFTVGSFLHEHKEHRFASLEDTVAEFVLLELDYWVSVDEFRKSNGKVGES